MFAVPAPREGKKIVADDDSLKVPKYKLNEKLILDAPSYTSLPKGAWVIVMKIHRYTEDVKYECMYLGGSAGMPTQIMCARNLNKKCLRSTNKML